MEYLLEENGSFLERNRTKIQSIGRTEQQNLILVESRKILVQ